MKKKLSRSKLFYIVGINSRLIFKETIHIFMIVNNFEKIQSIWFRIYLEETIISILKVQLKLFTVAATVGCAVLVSFANTSSIATLWMTINQLQIFF